jgi:hypothetical protein
MRRYDLIQDVGADLLADEAMQLEFVICDGGLSAF